MVLLFDVKPVVTDAMSLGVSDNVDKLLHRWYVAVAVCRTQPQLQYRHHTKIE